MCWKGEGGGVGRELLKIYRTARGRGNHGGLLDVMYGICGRGREDGEDKELRLSVH